MKMTNFIPVLLALLISSASIAQDRPQTPIMGWASWNHYRINIDENIIKVQADAMASNGMKEAGYQFINVDDGYFGGRDSQGQLLSHPQKFPGGMKALATYIHSKGLKAGIYSDAGSNTCGSHWDNDPYGIGVGLYGHEESDLELILNEWNYDFIKIDWCGGKWLKMDREATYTHIGSLIRQIKPSAVYNVCCWEFPGEWVTSVADSWRISGDITNKFNSILRIIDLNAELSKYASPGHVNDMDMLQVGRGMTYEEDKAHFSMWCMMSSPLLAGNDLTTMSAQTLDILTNKELIAINQDPLVQQAVKVKNDENIDVWVKCLQTTNSGEIAVTLLNRSKKKNTMRFTLKELGLDASKGYTMRDLWLKKDYSSTKSESAEFDVEGHGVVVQRIKGECFKSE